MHSHHNDEGGASVSAEEDPLAEARRLIAEHERQQDEACAAEMEQVLAKYGRRLQAAPGQISLVPR